MNMDKLLNKYIDKDYKKFHEKLCHTKYEIMGVKVPILRKISKELLKNYNYQIILNNLNYKYYEHVMIHGFVIANLKVSKNELLKLIKDYIKLIDNWALCDTFVSELKYIKNNKEEFLSFILPFLNLEDEYFKRLAIVVLLNYYIDDEYIDFILNSMLNIKSDFYYVNMAISWCYSICLIKYFDKSYRFLIDNKNNIDKWVYNKALQKGIESFRISNENKDKLRNLKL